MCLLTLVFPVYNSGRFLPLLLEGVNHSLRDVADRSEIQIVFVDGHSTDNTINLVEKFALEFPCQLIRRIPRGVYDAWNVGIECARGEWVWVVCSDDLLYDDSLGQIIPLLRQAGSSIGFVGWNINVIDETGSVVSNTTESSPLNYMDECLTRVRNTRSGRFEALALYLFRAHFLSFMAHAFRRKVWEEMMFPTNIGPSADIDWTLHAGLRGWSRFTVPQTLAAWRVHGGAATSNAKHQQRILAHAKLRAEVRSKLAALIRVKDSALEFEPAHDFYAWLSVYRQEKGPVRFRALIQSLRSAGLVGLLELTAGKLTNKNPLAAYRRPSRQFLRLLDKQEGDVVFE